jgi:hypothetical protein
MVGVRFAATEVIPGVTEVLCDGSAVVTPVVDVDRCDRLGRPGPAADVGLREGHAAGRCRPAHVPDGRQRGVAHTWPRPTLLGKSRRPRFNAWGVRVTRGMP